MGACSRPNAVIWPHGMFQHGELVAVTIGSSLIRERVVGGMTRENAMELARLCAARTDLCRVMLRLWREMIFPAYGYEWAISYQDEALHSGDTALTAGLHSEGRGPAPIAGAAGKGATRRSGDGTPTLPCGPRGDRPPNPDLILEFRAGQGRRR
jgi:antitoxin VapB